jgi:hypothetical protein
MAQVIQHLPRERERQKERDRERETQQRDTDAKNRKNRLGQRAVALTYSTDFSRVLP